MLPRESHCGSASRRDRLPGGAWRRARRRTQRVLAVAHSLLVAAWHVLTTHTSYHDLGGDYFIARDNPEHRRRRALLQLERLGYRVTLEPVVT
jgi:hypothetical protein